MRILLLSVFTLHFLFSFGQNSNDTLRKPCEFPPYINDSEVYDIVEYQPSFPKGKEKLNKYIKKKFNNPNNKADSSIASVYVRFIVDETGKCVYPCVTTKGNVNISADLEKAAIELVNKMPNWTPGKHRGENKNVFAFIKIVLKEK